MQCLQTGHPFLPLGLITNISCPLAPNGGGQHRSEAFLSRLSPILLKPPRRLDGSLQTLLNISPLCTLKRRFLWPPSPSWPPPLLMKSPSCHGKGSDSSWWQAPASTGGGRTHHEELQNVAASSSTPHLTTCNACCFILFTWQRKVLLTKGNSL